MPQILPADFSAQLSSILNAYSTVSESGDLPATTVSGWNSVGALTSGANINSLASLTSLSSLDPAWLSSMINNFALPAFSIGSIVLSIVAVVVLRYAKEKVKARIWARAFDKRAKKFLKRYDTERGGQEALVKTILGDLTKSGKLNPQTPVAPAPVQPAPVQAPVQQVAPQAPNIFQIPPMPPIPQMPPHATQV